MSKSISSAVDLDDLPSRRDPKKQKPSKTSLPKVPKFTPPTVNLDDPLVDVEWTSIGETFYSQKIYSKNFQKEIYLLKNK